MDKSQYDAGLDDAAAGAQSFGDKLKGGLGTAAKVAAGALAAVGAAAGTAAAVVSKEVGAIAAYGDNIDKASQKLGISAEAYQEWEAIMQHSGTTMDAMSGAFKTLQNAMAGPTDEQSIAFKNLGISSEIYAMKTEDAFNLVISKLQEMPESARRTAIAQKLLGRGAMEMGALLNTSAKDTQAMRDRVHELGGVMSDEAVKASARYQDSLQDFTTALDGAKRNMMSEFLPGIADVMDGLAEMMTGGDGLGKINQGIDSVIQGVTEMIPRVLEIGTQIVTSLAGAIIENLPEIANTASQTILTLGTGIIEHLPMLIQAGLQILITLAQAIADNLPTLIPTIVDVVLEIVDILTEPSTLSALVDAAIAIIIALAQGLIEALPRLLEKAPEIIMQLVTAIISLAPQMLQAALQLMVTFAQGIVQGIGSALNAIGQLGQAIFGGIGDIVSKAWQWGADLIKNFTDGLKAFISKPIDAIKGLADKIKNFLGFSEPEEGPLSNFHTYAPDMMKLFAEGITANRGLITNAIGSAFDFAPQIAGANAHAGGQQFSVSRGAPITQPTQINLILDNTVIGRALLPYINAEQMRMGIVLTGGAH